MASSYPLAGWTTLAIEGDDRLAWLQNLCTNDLRRLTPGAGCETFVTDVKGKVLGHLYLLVEAERTLAVTVPGQADQLLTHCDRYIIREEVRLADVSQQFAWRVIHGSDRSDALLAAPGSINSLPDEPWQHVAGGQDELLLLVVNSGAAIPETHWLATTPQAAASLDQTLRDLRVEPMSDDEFLRLRVEAAWPLWGIDFDAQNLPQEVARNEQAISFTKGCYLGQETVARIDALGHVNRQLGQVRFSSDRLPASGEQLTRDGKPVGQVTSAAWSAEVDSPLALAMLRRGVEAPGTKLESRVGPAVVTGS